MLMYPTRFYIVLLGFFLAALVFGALFFINGMGDASYLVNDGGGVGVRYINKPSYDRHFQGLIFALTFLAAGLLLLLLILLPDQRGMAAGSFQTTAAPQPRRRATQQAAPQPAPQAAQQTVVSPIPAGQAPSFAEASVDVAPQTVQIEAEAPPAAAAAPQKSLDEEVLTSLTAPAADLVDIPISRADETGEEDVVYGAGRVTDDSVWEFIQEYPDSAVKFLYRKTLENKALPPAEEDIYRRWEMRGMSRAKVREFVLGIMDWKALPDDFPHNIWRALRDQIFDNRTRSSAA